MTALEAEPSAGPPWEALEPHRATLIRLARRRGCNREDAEDIASEALLRAAVFPGLDPHRAGAFLNTVVQRLIVDLHRGEERHRRALPRLAEPVSVSSHEGRICEDHAARGALRQVADLPQTERDVLLARVEGHSVAAVATQLHLSPKTVEGAYTRARSRMRRYLVAGGVGLAACLRPRHAANALIAVPAAVLLTLPAVSTPADRVQITPATTPHLQVTSSAPGAPTGTAPHRRTPFRQVRVRGSGQPPTAVTPPSRQPVAVPPRLHSHDNDESLAASIARCLRQGPSLTLTTIGCEPSS